MVYLGMTLKAASENRKYMFAGEYVDLDKEIFNILNEYAGGKLDFNALKEGTQSCCLS